MDAFARTKRWGRATLLAVAAMLVGGITFAATQTIIGQEGSQDDLPAQRATYDQLEREELAKPRFAGEKLGIFIAPYDVPIPEKNLGYQCIDPATTVTVPWERAGQFALSLKLPPQFEFKPDDSNTGVIACDDHVYAARWTYQFQGIDGTVGNLAISRGEASWFPYDISADHVKVIAPGGREAVFLEPFAPDLPNTSAVILFPESFGQTEIQAYNMPISDILAVADAVGNATR